jgi:hypothetical protein
VVAPAQGDEGESPGEVENPGEHRASDGLNTRLGATNSRGEKGPEDEPISLTYCMFPSRKDRDLGLGPGGWDDTRFVNAHQLRLVVSMKDARRTQSPALPRR